jgi:hypothetical protein
MATSTASSTSSPAAATGGQGADDNYAFQSGADGGADPQGGDNLPGDPPTLAQPPAAATPPSDTGTDDSRSSDPLKAERRKISLGDPQVANGIGISHAARFPPGMPGW